MGLNGKKSALLTVDGRITGAAAIFLFFLFLDPAGVSGFAMTSSRQDSLHLKIAAVDGHSTISMIKMFVERPILGKNVVAEYESVRSPDLIAAKAISGEADFIIVPTNMGAKLYNKGVPCKMAAVTIWGNLYLVSSQNINTWQDLEGRRLYLHAQGLTPDVVFRFLLKTNGLDPEKDVKITYLTGPHALAISFLGGKSRISMMPEPMLSRVMNRKPGTKIVFDLQKEWRKATGSPHPGFPQGSIMIKKSILKDYPDVADRFIDQYKESIAWVNANPEQAALYAEGIGTGMHAPAVQKAIPGCSLRYVPAMAAKKDLETFFQVLLEFSPETIGGRIPDADFYLQK
jgi:NitT/TauT family transport system substrate-binding protein